MKLFRFSAPLLVLAACAFADPSGGINYSLSGSGQARAHKYHFVAWPKGSAKPVYFRSGIYVSADSASFVRLDDNKLRAAREANIRFPEAFDSLKGSRVQPVFIAGSEYALDNTWSTATVMDRRWVFPRVSGAVTLWSKAPGGGAYVAMDTGAGVEKYQEAAVRRKIASNPAAARLLRDERLGKNFSRGMVIGGAALTGAGVATSFKPEGFEPNGLVFGGIILASVSWLPHLIVQGVYEKAVRAYNATTPVVAPSPAVPGVPADSARGSR